MLRPGESVHYASLLSEDGEVLCTIPMDNPVAIPKDEYIRMATVDIKINVHLELKAVGKR